VAPSGSTISHFKKSTDVRVSRVTARLEAFIATGLIVSLVFATLAHGAVEPWSLALFELMLIGLLLAWGAKATLDRRLEITIPGAAFPMAVLLSLGIAQSFAFTSRNGQRLSLSMDVEATRQTVTLLFLLTFGFLVASNFLVSRERLSWLAKALTVFGALLAGFALVQDFAWNGKFYWLRPTTQTVFGPFVNHNQFAGYMAMLAPIPIVLMVRVVDGHRRLLFGFAAALMGTAVIVSNSRSGVISLAASIVFLTLLNLRSRIYLGLIGVIIVAIIAGVLWVGAAQIVGHFGEAVDQLVQSGTPDVGRAMIWRGAVNMIAAHPVLGVGLGAFVTIYPTYESTPISLTINYAHNDYLQALAEGGVIAGILVVWFITVVSLGIRKGIRSPDPLVASMSLAAAAGIIAILVQSITDTDLQIPSNALLFLILVSIVSRPRQPEAALL
jgi:O-antigen ligase